MSCLPTESAPSPMDWNSPLLPSEITWGVHNWSSHPLGGNLTCVNLSSQGLTGYRPHKEHNSMLPIHDTEQVLQLTSASEGESHFRNHFSLRLWVVCLGAVLLLSSNVRVPLTTATCQLFLFYMNVVVECREIKQKSSAYVCLATAWWATPETARTSHEQTSS